MERIVSLCKRRGFVYQASEIYGGIGNTYTAPAFVGGGETNAANGAKSTISGGFLNIANGAYTSVGGGAGNTAAQAGVIAGGLGNDALGASSAVGGGYNNNATGNSGTSSKRRTRRRFFRTPAGGTWPGRVSWTSFASRPRTSRSRPRWMRSKGRRASSSPLRWNRL